MQADVFPSYKPPFMRNFRYNFNILFLKRFWCRKMMPGNSRCKNGSMGCVVVDQKGQVIAGRMGMRRVETLEIWLFECWHLKMWKSTVCSTCLHFSVGKLLWHVIQSYLSILTHGFCLTIFRYLGNFQNHEGSQVIFQVKLAIFDKRKPMVIWHCTPILGLIGSDIFIFRC